MREENSGDTFLYNTNDIEKLQRGNKTDENYMKRIAGAAISFSLVAVWLLGCGWRKKIKIFIAGVDILMAKCLKDLKKKYNVEN